MDRKILLLALLCLYMSGLYAQMCDPAPGDSCTGAPLLCSIFELENFECRNPPPPGPYGPSPLCPGGGVPNNMSWWAFVAGDGNTTLQITASNCTTVDGQMGIQAGVYTDCTYEMALFCQPACWVGTQVITGRTVPCQVYYLFIDGCNGSECDYSIKVLAGANPPSAQGPPILELPDTVLCAGGPVCVRAETPGICRNQHMWRINGLRFGVTENELCDLVFDPGTVEICVKAVVGNEQRICSEARDWVCRTVEVIDIPGDTIVLPPDTVCLEPDQEFFPNACGNPVRVTEGSQQICCDTFTGSGCMVRYCEEVFFTRRAENRSDTVLLCPDEFFVAPNGDTLSRCGQYTLRMPGQGSDKCDEVVNYTVVKPNIRLTSTIGHCQDGKSCIWADVTDWCDPGVAEYEYRWLDAESNRVLAIDTLSLCVDISGEYCLELTPIVGGRRCQPYFECETVNIPVPAPPPILGDTVLCGRNVFEFSIPFGSYREVEWSTDRGELRQTANPRIIELDMSNATGDTVTLCVRIRNDCGLSSWGCRELVLYLDVLEADFTYTIVGDSVFFMSTVRDAVSYIWNFGDGNSSTERDPVHRFAGPGEYQVGLIIRDECFSDFEVKLITIRMTSTGDQVILGELEAFPNPGTGLFTLRSGHSGLSSGEVRVRVTDIHGRLIADHQVDGHGFSQGWRLDLTGADAGVYSLLAEADGVYFACRLVVTR